MPNANLIVGNDAGNTLLGTAGRDLVYGFDPNGPQGNVTSIAATHVASLHQPVFMGAPPDDLERLFIVGRTGEISILDLATGQMRPQSFLDLAGQITDAGEAGLLGLAFDPDFASNGYFYVDLTNLAGDTEIRRYRVSDANPNLADPASATTIITIDHPVGHKAGWLGFGPDGYLYAALGDGGGQDDPDNNGQNPDTLLGKMLRLDVRSDAFPGDSLRNYAIPAGNPFVGTAGADEIYALGLRNPWRNSFDRAQGDFYIADVGERAFEEVNLGAAGANYGWDSFEGAFPHNATPLGPGTLTNPIHQYDHTHTVGHSVTGGYVYRGGSEGLQGVYFFADYITNKVFTLRFDGTAWVATDRTAQLVPDVPGPITNLAAFGEDGAGNLYLAAINQGRVFRLTPVVASADAGDVLNGLAGEDILFGGSGNDRVNGGADADTMLGGLGNDTYTVDRADDMVIEAANQGADTVFASAGYTLPGGSAVETLRVSGPVGLSLGGNGLANTLFGGIGSDRLNGAAGNDVLYGGAGGDTHAGGNGNDISFLDSVSDVMIETAAGGVDRAYVGARASGVVLGANVELGLVWGSGARTIFGGSTDNTLFGGTGNDRLDGGDGLDRLVGGDGNDLLNGGLQNDQLEGRIGADSLFGGAGNDRLYGGAGTNRLEGGDGNDTFYLDSVSDVMIETAAGGLDRVLVGAGASGIVLGANVELGVAWGSGARTIFGGSTDNTLFGGTGNDRLDGGNGLDRLVGGDGNDLLNGGLQNDQLEGRIGADSLFGGAGNDRLYGGAGTNRLEGGDGNDTFYLDSVSDVMIETAAGGLDRALVGTGASGIVLGANVELGLVWGSGARTIFGGSTNNTLFGGTGNDRLEGGDGLDRLVGGVGNDRLTGGTGIDTIQGGVGIDTATGGSGADRFLYSAGDGNDRFIDFSAAAGDKVDLSGVTVSNIANNVATLSDGSVLTAQAGYVWTGADFI